MTDVTFLLVDDSETEQFLYRHIIESYSEQITLLSAHDGEEALDVLDKKGPSIHCILLDINMPRMNGFEFLEAYTEKHKDSQAVIVMLSSSNYTTDKEKALSFSCVSDYITKPLTPSMLDKILDIAEDKKSQAV